MTDLEIKKWQSHQGQVVATANGYDVIECTTCGFKHIIAIPSEECLEQVYRDEFYEDDKPHYIDRYREDLEWWNTVYTRRYDIIESHLQAHQRKILDIGSGPGYFISNGKNRGWQVKGIEPSVKACQHSRLMGLDVENRFFDEQASHTLGTFDVINMGEVLEHIPNPFDLLDRVHRHLNTGGLVCLIVPNDFNPLQLVLRDHLGFSPWWVGPPHHINYFNFKSLAKLVNKCGFEVVHQESTFPIDMFLLMGENYIGNDNIGRACHTKRMSFEKSVTQGGGTILLSNLYASFANQGIGREVVLFARKVNTL
jgi:2-polyprenyl-3-methyl-5-hydroxy-6-metoxy-1,4-benzoquinol methylase